MRPPKFPPLYIGRGLNFFISCDKLKPMKTSIHPEYHQATVKCACGNTWKTGSTLSEIALDICDKCHPFYTGKEKLLDTRGRIDKFKRRMVKSEESIKAKTAKKPRAKKAS
jgi:large subunit ribosomal protein L31